MTDGKVEAKGTVTNPVYPHEVEIRKGEWPEWSCGGWTWEDEATEHHPAGYSWIRTEDCPEHRSQP